MILILWNCKKKKKKNLKYVITAKYYIESVFLNQYFESVFAYLRTAFLQYTSRYVSVWVKQKISKAISKDCIFNL